MRAPAAAPPAYVAAQSTSHGRAGRVDVDTDADADADADGTIWVGGATVTAISGAFNL